MKKLFKVLTVLPVLLAFLVAGCTVDDPDSSTDLVAPSGEQLFSDYVAIGNSLTAGFMDGGLVINGQRNSYPRLIATQIGAPEFDQPYISFPGVGSTKDPVNHPADAAGVLYWNGSAPAVVDWTPMTTVMDPASGFLMALTLPTPYHNLGVPGATMHDVMNAIDATTSSPVGNSYFNFINRPTLFGNVNVPAVAGVSPAYQTASMFRAAVAKGPKLLTCWIGNNDILGSAMAGTDAAITSSASFQAEYTALLQSLAGGLVQRNGFPSTIVVANIPSITSIPYFVQRAFIEADAPGGLGVVWPWGYEEATTELVTFPGLAWLQDAANAGNPVPAGYTLSTAEVASIATAVATYNGIIAGVAAAVNASGYATCGVFDANALMAGLPVAQRTHFMFLEAAYGEAVAAQTTLFSLDGVHPNNMGYAVVANGFIEKINELAGTSVATIDPSALSWDPTYGQDPVDTKAGGLGRISPEAAEAMGAIFR